MTEPLSFDHLTSDLRGTLENLPDHRQGKNTQYTLSDAGMSAFSVFFTQCPSFLAHQRLLETNRGKSNATTLFSMEKIPCDNQIRKLLDAIGPDELYPVFWSVYDRLKHGGYLSEYTGFSQNLLLSLDGLEYFSSKTIHCSNCRQKQSRDESTIYSHSVITSVLVSTRTHHVIALEPEFIDTQDGYDKQDCEQNAIKRWIERNATRFPPHQITILADDLHCKQPLLKLLLDSHFNFIVVCKPQSHKTLYRALQAREAEDLMDGISKRKWNGRFHELWQYRYTTNLPLRASDDTLSVNWCELTITREDTREILYRNAFATNHWLCDDTVELIVKSGRARWKTENENNNVLKNRGYHLEHNFGHGKQHLSAVLLVLNLLAFLFHTVLDKVDRKYQKLRRALATRVTFFNDIRALTRYLIFDNWEHLLDFMLNQLEIDLPP